MAELIIIVAVAIGVFLISYYLMLCLVRISDECRIRREGDSLMSFMESMNLTNLPVVTFEADTTDGERVKLNFILDSGSDQSLLDMASLLNLKVLNRVHNKTTTASGIEGFNEERLLCSEITLYYKGMEFTDDFALKDLTESFGMIKQKDGVTVHGILSSAFLQKYKYVLDFDELIAYMKK